MSIEIVTVTAVNDDIYRDEVRSAPGACFGRGIAATPYQEDPFRPCIPIHRLAGVSGKVVAVLKTVSARSLPGTPWTEWTNSSFGFNTGGYLWRVDLKTPLPESAYTAITKDPRGVAGFDCNVLDSVIQEALYSKPACAF